MIQRRKTMPYLNRTYRIEDGERIEGSWRHIFIKNGDTYHLTELKVYADGMIDCWGLVDFATFQQKVASGWVATTIQQNARASAHHLASWRFNKPSMWLEPQDLLAEVADEIEHLAGRPTSEERCLEALDRYLDDLTPENLRSLREAYLAVPEHLRLYLLGDQDAKDWPLRRLIIPIGEALDPEYAADSTSVMSTDDQEKALHYFRQRREQKQQRQIVPPSWKDDVVTSKSLRNALRCA
jgi:hypothetical protein